MSTVQGNASRKVEIVVLETSASYCPAERVANNRGDFRLAQLRCPLPALCPSEAAGDPGVPLLSHPPPESAVGEKPLIFFNSPSEICCPELKGFRVLPSLVPDKALP